MLKNNARYASIVRSVCWSARLVNRREINSSFYPGYEEKRSESSAIIDLSDFVRFDVWAVWNRPPWKNENHERLNVPRLTEFLVSSVNRGCDYFVRWRKERKKKKEKFMRYSQVCFTRQKICLQSSSTNRSTSEDANNVRWFFLVN